jgi:hypothetical protein
MATDLIKSLRERQDALREELLEDPKFQEYDLVTQLLQRHEASVVVTKPIPLMESVKVSSQQRKLAVRPRAHFQRTATGMAAVVEASADYLRRKGSRAGSAELHSELVRRRILHSGSDDRSKVTSYLGRKKDLFDNVRGEGYGLREWAIANSTVGGKGTG